MKWTTLFRFFIGIFLTQSYVSYSQTSDEILSIINSNISNRDIDKNLNVYKELKSKNYFDTIDCQQASRILHKIGVALYLKDANLEAANFYKTNVLPSWESCTDRSLLEYANSLYNTGVSLQFADKYQEARPYFHRSMEFFESDTSYNQLKLSSKYAGMARFYKDAQSYIRAVNYYKAAIQIMNRIDGQSSRLGRYQQALGITLNEMGQYNQAIPYFKKTIEIFKTNKDQRRLAMAYQNIAISYLESDSSDSTHYSLDSAQYFVEQALNLHRENNSFLSNDYEILGLIYKKRNEFDKSRSFLLQSLELRKSGSSNRRAVSSSFENLSELDKDFNPAQSRILIDSAIASLVITSNTNKLGNPRIKDIITLNDVSVIRAMGIKADLYAQEIDNPYDRSVVLDIYKKIDSLFTINIFNLHFEKSRLSYFQLLFDHYSDAIDYCVALNKVAPQKGYDELAFNYATKTKSLVLLNEIKENEWYSEHVNIELEQEKNERQIEVRNLFAKLVESSGDSSSINSNYLKAQRNLEFTLAKIDSAVGKTNKDKYALQKVLDVKGIQAFLKRDELYLEYFLGKKNLYSFLISKDTFYFTEHPDLSNIKSHSLRLRDLIENRTSSIQDINDTRNQLSSLLLPEAINLYSAESKKWTIVPDGFLHQISFDVLNLSDAPEKYLIEDVILSISYSSGTSFHHKDATLGSEYIGFGTTYTQSLNDGLNSNISRNASSSFSQLLLAEDEIVSCANIMNGKAFVGVHSTKASFEEKWPSGDMIHISLHGYVDSAFYDKSFLLFDNRSKDNVLFLPELFPSHDNVQLVVLSSCHTASGQLFKGDGVQGLTKAFMKAGNATVVSSLWEASDLSASQIMPWFFKKLKSGNNVGLALNNAKLEYFKSAPPSQKHPYYWANFQIIGQSDLSLEHGWSMWFVVGLLFFIITIITVLKKRATY